MCTQPSPDLWSCVGVSQSRRTFLRWWIPWRGCKQFMFFIVIFSFHCYTLQQPIMAGFWHPHPHSPPHSDPHKEPGGLWQGGHHLVDCGMNPTRLPGKPRLRSPGFPPSKRTRPSASFCLQWVFWYTNIAYSTCIKWNQLWQVILQKGQICLLQV